MRTIEHWMDAVMHDRCPGLLRGDGIELSRKHLFVRREGSKIVPSDTCLYCKMKKVYPKEELK